MNVEDMTVEELTQRKREIEEELRPLLQGRNTLRRALLSGRTMDKKGTAKRLEKVNTQIATLKSEYDQIVYELSYLSDDEERPRKQAKTDISPEKRGGNIGLTQMEQMNLFGVGDIFR